MNNYCTQDQLRGQLKEVLNARRCATESSLLTRRSNAYVVQTRDDESDFSALRLIIDRWLVNAPHHKIARHFGPSGIQGHFVYHTSHSTWSNGNCHRGACFRRECSSKNTNAIAPAPNATADPFCTTSRFCIAGRQVSYYGEIELNFKLNDSARLCSLLHITL